MNLDDIEALQKLDPENMLAQLDKLPERFETAWRHSNTLGVPNTFKNVQHVVIAGVGDSIISGDLVASALADYASIPITVIRDYQLPQWVNGNQVLVIVISFSGDDEEPLTIYEQAVERDVQILGITTGGQLSQNLAANNHTVWIFPQDVNVDREAIGWLFGLLLGLASHSEWVTTLENEVLATVEHLKSQREHYQFSTRAAVNPAKRQAGQFIGRLPVFVGGGSFKPIARRWKTQFNQNAKTLAIADSMPEMKYNSVVGIEFPDIAISKLVVMFITSPDYDHPRLRRSHQAAFEMLMLQGIAVDRFQPTGGSTIAQLMHAIQFGDYMSYYAAIAHGANPSDISPVIELKQSIAARD
jgi:glucose/mannose-6-phosphate isomerase